MALTLNGSSQYGTIASTLLAASSDTWTLCVWYKPSTLTARMFLGGFFRNDTSLRSVAMVVRGDQAGDPGAGFSYNGSDEYLAGTNDIAGWKCCVFLKTQAGDTGVAEYKVYDNTETASTGSMSYEPMSLVGQIKLGAGYNGSSHIDYFAGRLAHFALWDGTVLSSGERTDLITNLKRPDQITTAPTYYRRLISDSTTGAGADTLTLTGSPSFDSDDPLPAGTSTPYVSLTPQRNVRHGGRYF